MKRETFFEKFDQFADARNAVEKMRTLVLDLAVKGKLTDREEDSESVDPKYSDEPSSEALPANWRLLNFGKFCDIQGGNQPPKSQFSDKPMPGYIRMFQIRDLGERPVPTYISKNSTNRFCRDGEILIGRYGASVGKVFWAQDGAYNVALAKFIYPEDALLPGFAFRVLKSDFFQAEIAGASRSAQAGFNKGDLAAINFPLPPLAEQKRIVAKVDELMALCDRLALQQQERETRHAALARASLARFAEAPTPTNLSFLFHRSYTISPADLRNSILALAVQGKLVPQDPSDEPADILLARIDQKRTSLLEAGYPNRGEASTQLRKQKAQVLPNGLEPLAPGWGWATLIQASLLVVDCHNKTAPYVDSGIRLLRTTNIRNGQLNLLEPKFVDDATYERWSARCKPEPGDVLITREAPMGEVCAVPQGMRICLGQRMMLIRLVPETMDTKYLLYSLMAPDLMDRVQDKPVGATVQHLRVGGVETLLTPIPPISEQRRIVAKVDQLMALIDQLEAQLTASRATATRLLDAIVAELTAA